MTEETQSEMRRASDARRVTVAVRAETRYVSNICSPTAAQVPFVNWRPLIWIFSRGQTLFINAHDSLWGFGLGRPGPSPRQQ